MGCGLCEIMGGGELVGRSVGLSVCRSVAEGSEHATYGDRPCFSCKAKQNLK